MEEEKKEEERGGGGGVRSGRKVRKNASFIIANYQNAIQVYAHMSMCQQPAVKHLSSHLSMIHGLNGHEPTPHLKKRCIVFYYNATTSTATKDKSRKG